MKPKDEDGALFRALVRGALDVLCVASADGVIRYINPAVRAQLGYSPEELIGRTGFATVHPDDQELAASVLKDVVSSNEVSAPTIFRALHKDGSWVYVETIAQSLLDDPEVRGVIINSRDVTDRIRASERLEESEARFRAVFEQVRDGVVLVDRGGVIVDANRAASALLGRERHSVVGQKVAALLGGDAAKHDAGAVAIARPDGAIRYVEYSATPLEVSGTQLLLGVLRDVTTHRETERAKERFFAMVAHELRTPVAVLMSSIEVLRTRLASLPFDDQRALLTAHKEEIDRLARIVADVLDLAAIQTGRLSLRPSPTALAPVIAGAAGRVALQFAKRAKLDLSPIEAVVDVGRFEQVLTNLLDNAWRHGGQNVTVRLRADDSSARVEVIDDGPGIHDEVRKKIFGSYYVAGEHPTSGIGIGLWLSKQLVVAMGGSIDVVRPDGGGTSIMIHVPLAGASSAGRSTTAP